MKRFLVSLIVLKLFLMNSQYASAQSLIDSFWRFTDFHIHPTYKHYFRFPTYKPIMEILAGSEYDSVTRKYKFSDAIRQSYGNDYNWEVYNKAHRKQKLKQLKKGEISNLRNYDQSSYAEIMFTPGALLCDSYSPYEKQFAYGKGKRFISWLIVTKMGLKRLKKLSDEGHTPYNDFLAEYYYNQIQNETKKVITHRPVPLYSGRVDSFHKNAVYHNKIHMVENADTLRRIPIIMMQYSGVKELSLTLP